MSRSKRKTSISGVANSVSEKQFKRHTNHVFRATQRELLKTALVDEDVEAKLPKKPRDSTNPWSGDKDGKSYFGRLKKKDPKYYEKLMRK